MANANESIIFDQTQSDAATARERHVLVMGGPGTGKSLVLHARAASMLGADTSPAPIYYLTPNLPRSGDIKAAFPEELGRLTSRVSREAAQTVRVLAVPSLAHGWLLNFGPSTLGMSGDYTVWSPRQSEEAVRELLRTGTYRNRIPDEDVPDILRWHSLRRSRLPEADIEGIPALWREIVDLYEKEKRRRNVLDEEDLAPFAVRSMEGRPDVLRDWRSRVAPRLLVDDFQNLTPVEYRLLQLVAGPDGWFTAAGDPNQRVGAWRGVEGGLLTRFTKDYPGCKRSRLPFNYRSTEALNAFATKFLKARGMDDLSSSVRQAHPDSGPSPGSKPRLVILPESQDAVDQITALQIHQQHGGGLPWQNMALLCRRHSSIDRLVKVLASRGIPHTVQGDIRRRREQDAGDRVTVSTFHAAQGQQWPFVWIADVSQHIVPGPLGRGDGPWLAEERRLFYIASTRASERLFFYHSTDGGRVRLTPFLSKSNDTISVLG